MLGGEQLPTLAELFVGDLAATGNWVVANVRSSVAWPLHVQAVDFREHRIFLVPRSSATAPDGSVHTLYPFVGVNLPRDRNFKEGRRLLSHFLSSLSWVEGGAITVEHWSGGSRAHPMGESRIGGIVTQRLELEYLPDPMEERVRWALAFYREGLALDRYNIAYAVLSFFKILNIVADTGRKQKAWINTHLANFGPTNLIKFEIQRRLDELRASGITDIGDYLYDAGRCAVAHAGANPTIDPENPDDIERLSKDLPLIRAMAAHVIENDLGVKSSYRIWQEHLYELAGFQELLDRAVAERLKARDATVAAGECTVPARISIRIRNRDPYLALDNLTVRNITVDSGSLSFAACSNDNLIKIDLTLNFPEPRMLFDWQSGITVSDDGSERSAKQIGSVLRFLSDYVGNGKLEVFNAETGTLLGRKDAYIPINIIPGFAEQHFNQLIEKYQAEAEVRSLESREAGGETSGN